MTPHNEANVNDIAKTVLMPGDPLRAKYMAETFLTDYKLVNTIRNMYAYTGYYKGKRLTIMAHGLGIASMGVYSYELFKFYNVKNIIRIGTTGAYTNSLNLLDLILVDKSYSESTYALQQNNSSAKLLPSSNMLNNVILEKAKELKYEINFSNVHCSDVFYTDLSYKTAIQNGCISVEMESFSLFHNAITLGGNAACILSVSDSLVKPEELSPEERQTGLDKMFKLALESAIEIS